MRLTDETLRRAEFTVRSLAANARGAAQAAEEAWSDGSPALPELLVTLCGLNRLSTGR